VHYNNRLNMKFDELLCNDRLGEFGRYQQYVYTLTCLPAIWSAMIIYSWSFTGADVGHRWVDVLCFGGLVAKALRFFSSRCRLDENDTRFEANYSSVTLAYRGDGQCARVNVHTDERVDCTHDGYLWDTDKTSALQQVAIDTLSGGLPHFRTRHSFSCCSFVTVRG
jgi:hypothetical protein